MSNTKIRKKFIIIENDNESKSKDEVNKIKEINNKLINDYIESLDDFELQAMDIAKRMLESSFDLEKSIGFLNFKKSKTLY
tara:strand:- start:112 stop:354 length:243 start_codon:yes stop_codon:yes gene_type:complete